MAEAKAHEGPNPLRWLLLLGFVLASMLEVLDTSIVNPVLPTMAGNLGCTTDEIAWVSTAYILANVVVLPMTAWFSQKLGMKRYLFLSIILFLASSVLCGFSSGLGQMVVWRLVQGAAGAALISMTQAAIAEVFPPAEQTVSQTVWVLGIVVAPALAPALGGWIADNYAWPWIFFINVPIGILAILIIATFYHEKARAAAPGAIDLFGIGLLTVGLGSIQYVLEEGNRKDWFADSLIARLTWLGLASLAVFVWWELSPRNRGPIVNLRVLKDRGLAAGVVLGFVAGIGFYSGLYMFPIFAQTVLGFTATKSGTFMFLPGIALAISVVVSGAAMQNGVAARDLVTIGMLCFMWAMWVLGHQTSMSNESDAQLGLYYRQVGTAMIMMPVAIAGIAGLRGEAIGQGAALLGLARQLGGSIGIAVAATYLTQMTAFHRYHLTNSLYDGNPLLNDRVGGMTMAFYGQGMDMEHARMAALKALDGQVTIQAYTMAGNNVYILTGILLAAAFPFIFMMRRASAAGAAGAH